MGHPLIADESSGHSASVSDSAKFFFTSFGAIKDRSPCKDKPAQDGHARQDRRDRMVEQ
jgi:hypothetical protein